MVARKIVSGDSMNQPPNTNKGGNPPLNPYALTSDWQTPQISIDWLQYTCEWPNDVAIEAQLTRCVPPFPEFAIMPDEAKAGISGYTDSRHMRIGKVYWHAKKRSQRVLVVLTGDNWQDIETANIDPITILDWIQANGHRITRIDLALDLFGWDANYMDIRAWFDHDTMATDAVRCGLYDDHRKDTLTGKSSGTVYLGSSASDRQLRVYDKGAEQLRDVNWLRVELVLRHDRAQAFGEHVNRADLATLARSQFADFVLAPDTWYEMAIEGKMIDIKPIGKRDTDTARWLMKSVLPALERELLQERDMGEGKLLAEFATLIDRFR